MSSSTLREILFISHKYPPSTGGMEKFSYELVHGFEDSDVTAHKLVFTGGESKLWWFLSLRSRVRAIFLKYPSIQVVHINDALMAFFCRWIQNEFKVVVIPTFHGLDVVFPLGIYQRKIFPGYTAAYDSFVCVSRATANAAIERGITRDRIQVINNGVDHNIANPKPGPDIKKVLLSQLGIQGKENKKIIVGLGRGVRRKGFGWFVSNILPHLDKDIMFIMLGPRSSYEWQQKWVSKIFPASWKKNIELMLGLSTDDQILMEAITDPILLGRFYRPGYLKYDDVMSVIRSADLFIMPNLKEHGDMEGFGLVALEASLSGAYVMASAVDGITDAIIDGKNGKLIESGNVQTWISTISVLMQDVEKLKLMGVEGKEYTLLNFGWEKMVNEYRDHFQEVYRQAKLN